MIQLVDARNTKTDRIFSIWVAFRLCIIPLVITTLPVLLARNYIAYNVLSVVQIVQKSYRYITSGIFVTSIYHFLNTISAIKYIDSNISIIPFTFKECVLKFLNI